MNLSSITAVGWCANMMLDRKEQAPFTFDELYTAAERGKLVELLLKIDDNGLIALCVSRPEERAEVERALRLASEGLQDREMRKAGVGENALCLVMAFVLEAIQQNFRS